GEAAQHLQGDMFLERAVPRLVDNTRPTPAQAFQLFIVAEGWQLGGGLRRDRRVLQRLPERVEQGLIAQELLQLSSVLRMAREQLLRRRLLARLTRPEIVENDIFQVLGGPRKDSAGRGRHERHPQRRSSSKLV